MEKTIRYLNALGEINIFNITEEVCARFGFLHNQRFITPEKKQATVVGVQISGCPWCKEFRICKKGRHAPTLWFHVDGERGATFLPLFSKEEFQEAGFKLAI